MKCRLVVLFAALACVSVSASVARGQSPVQLEPVLSGLTSPVYVGNARDGSNRLFVVEQGGRVLVLQPGATTPTVFLDISTRVSTGGERGLLGLAFHPRYSTNRRFFVNYTRASDGATVVAEYRASAANPNAADTTEIPVITVAQPFSNHNGGMIEFGPDGFLYVGMGDGGSANDPGDRAQNPDELLGKMLRIDVDTPNGSVPYSSPPDNPFFGSTPGRDEIFATGFRNPYRWSFDRLTGQLWAGDVGQGQREEIDIVTLGGNYGWRVFEGTRCTGLGPAPCTPSNYVAPVAEYSHGSGRCSVTGGYVYRGPRHTLPAGTYLFADFCTGEIFTLTGGGGPLSLLLDTSLNVSSFGEDEAGEIYVVNLGGMIHRLTNSLPPRPGTLNLAVGKTATQSSTAFGAEASRAVDGNASGNWFADNSVSSTSNGPREWWEVDLGEVQALSEVRIWNRTDCCSERLSNFYVLVSDTPFVSGDLDAVLSQPGVSSYRFASVASSPSVLNVNRTGRYVRVQLTGADYLSLAEVQVFGTQAPVQTANLALGRATSQSSTGFGGVASRAVDGNADGVWTRNSMSTTLSEPQAWWEVDLGASRQLDHVRVWNRTDCCTDRLANFYVLVSDAPFASTDLTATLGQAGVSAFHVAGQAARPTRVAVNRSGRYVRVQLAGTNYLTLAEVEVWSVVPPVPAGSVNFALNKTAGQSSTAFGAAASRAADGNTSGDWFTSNSVSSTFNGPQEFWEVDLGAVERVNQIRLWNRTDCCSARLSNFYVFVSDVPFTSNTVAATQAQAGVTTFYGAGQAGTMSQFNVSRTARYVRVQLGGADYLSLAEVEVWGTP
ncbi:MAG TPA: PQQ-dependent sugar dehydrogenase [Pyrinomonadaceae bacterium]|nr:PQQ-dependent sugar dehydrogenase [Pyrinomonadaceae bacterium]